MRYLLGCRSHGDGGHWSCWLFEVMKSLSVASHIELSSAAVSQVLSPVRRTETTKRQAHIAKLTRGERFLDKMNGNSTFSSHGSLPFTNRSSYVNKRTDSDGFGTDLRVGGWENLVESTEHLGQSKHK